MGDIGAAAQAGASVASAGIQAAVANHAANLQADAAKNSLDFSKQQFNTQQANIQPYLGAGKQGLGALTTGLGLDNGTATSPGSLNQSFSYNPTNFDPTAFNPDSIVRNPDFAAPQTQTAQFDPASVNITQDPSYQFRYDQGLQALERNQAATGITGGAAAKALTDYGQGAASQEYANAYQRALSTSEQNASINAQNYGQAASTYGLDSSNHQQWITNALQANQVNNQFGLAANQANNANALNQYNAQTGQQTNQFNRLAAIAGLGQAGNTQLGNASATAQGNVMAANGAIGNAAAAGAVGMGNAFSNMATSVGQYFGNKYGG